MVNKKTVSYFSFRIRVRELYFLYFYTDEKKARTKTDDPVAGVIAVLQPAAAAHF